MFESVKKWEIRVIAEGTSNPWDIVGDFLVDLHTRGRFDIESCHVEPSVDNDSTSVAGISRIDGRPYDVDGHAWDGLPCDHPNCAGDIEHLIR